MILKADYEAKTVFEINYDKLKEDGIKVIVFFNYSFRTQNFF